MTAYAGYCRIPESYGSYLGGLRWSSTGDAVETSSGATFAFAGEVGLFLEGFASTGRLIHFAHALHLLHLMGHGRNFTLVDAGPLRRAYRQHRGMLRNAGVFCAVLCREVPGVPVPVDWTESRHESTRNFLGLLSGLAETGALEGVAEVPPLQPAELEERVLAALARYTPEEVFHWLRHGQGPVYDAGKRVVEEVLAAPARTLSQALAKLAQRPRLAGAVPYVAQMVSALTLPPRRLHQPELPLGGYSDVTTRGQPEQMLLSQFALDDLEFVRRLAARELLYFRREEPQALPKEELVLLLDQGVRTWGVVRLVLSAAVLALARKAIDKCRVLQLAVTSSGGSLIDPSELDEEKLGELLEASDLSPHPALALERVLEDRAELPRDVVLLTHPRNLDEPDVLAAARRALDPVRLFAVSVDDQGRTQLRQLRRGGTVPISQFKVDLVDSVPPVLDEKPVSIDSWTGAVEPIGFPFSLGLTSPVRMLDFDDSGDWLLMADTFGFLHACRLARAQMQTWPRGMTSQLMTEPEALVGVAGGFVVGYRAEHALLAYHYDLAQHHCCLHTLARVGPEFPSPWIWRYSREFHSIVASCPKFSIGVDLATGQNGQASPGGDVIRTRVEQACRRAIEEGARYPPPLVDRSRFWLCDGGTVVSLNELEGTLFVSGTPEQWLAITPLADGKPVLRGCLLARVQVTANILAVVTEHGGHWMLRVFRGPDGVLLREFRLHHRNTPFTVSRDGQFLAVEARPSRVKAHDLITGHCIWTSPVFKGLSELQLELGGRWLAIQAGNWAHLLRWDGGRLSWKKSTLARSDLIRRELGGMPERHQGITAQSPTWKALPYLQQRFATLVQVRGQVRAGTDGLSQVAILDTDGNLACMFHVFRDRLAGWLPDGTRLGPESLTGGPETPGALERIGRALLRAWQEGGTQ